MSGLSLNVKVEKWPIRGSFRISRGEKTTADVIVATVTDGKTSGRGECVPYTRYGETLQGVEHAISSMAAFLKTSSSRAELAELMPPGAARNAIDCALWDYEAKKSGQSAIEIASLTIPAKVVTAYTISLDTPENMANAAKANERFPLLKLKLGGAGDDERMAAIRAAVPTSRIVVDANEAWTLDTVERFIDAASAAKVELIEQPLPAGKDDLLDHIDRKVPICADESVHDRLDLPRLVGRYDAVNIKLDKTGGLTEALLMMEAARDLRMKTMVGCMVGTSLAMAPAMLLAQSADWVDLDGPLLLAKDREPGLAFDGACLSPPTSDLWG